MSTIRLLVIGVLGLLGIHIASADDKTDYATLLVGKWEVSKADPGTVPEGTIIEFTKDGKVKLAGKKDDQESMFEGTYKVEKNTFVMTVKVGDEEKKQSITITKISETEMSIKDDKDKVVEMKKKK